METLYRRILMLSNAKVIGYYRYHDLFQIVPPSKDAKITSFPESHHPCVIELKYVYQKDINKKITDGSVLADYVQQQDIERKLTVEIAALFDLLSFSVFIDYNNEQSWFINSEDNYKTCWGQKSYNDDTHIYKSEGFSDVTVYPEIEKIDFIEYYKLNGRYIGSDFQLPNNITNALDNYFSLEKQAKSIFLKSITLFRNGLRIKHISQSISLSCYISSLETLINFEHRNDKLIKCKQCGQNVYSVVKKFKEFIMKYGSEFPDFVKYCTKLYDKRSNILHAGGLFLGDDLPLDFGEYDEENFFLKINAEKITRMILINWLNSQK